MKKNKRNLVFTFLITIFVLSYAGERYYASESTNDSDINIEKLFLTDAFDDAKQKFGIYSMGAYKEEDILQIGLGVEDADNVATAKKYFEKRLSDIGVHDYTVKVLVR